MMEAALTFTLVCNVVTIIALVGSRIEQRSRNTSRG